MGAIDHDLLPRLLTRSEEVAVEPGMKPTVVLVYHDVLEKPAIAYLDASAQVKDADALYADKVKATGSALEALDGPYREARSVLTAYFPSVLVPATLKEQPTDTDQRNAVKDLHAEVSTHAGAAWADALLNGSFGQQAKLTMTALDESIAAGKGSTDAHHARAAAFEPAYDAFLKFKRVVRDALGPTSKQYQRLRVRQKGGVDAAEGSPKPPVTTSTGTSGGATTSTP